MSLHPTTRKGYATAAAVTALVVFDVVLIAFVLSRVLDGGGAASERQVTGRVESTMSDGPSQGPTAQRTRFPSPSANPTPRRSPTPSTSPSRSVSPSPRPSRTRPVPPSPTAPSSPTASRSTPVSPSPAMSSAPSPPPSPRRPALELRLPTSSATPSTTVKVEGRFVGADAGTRLVLERRNDGRWLPFPLSPVTLKGGRFITYVDLVAPGSYGLRVRDPERGLKSNTVVLRIG